MMKVWELSEKCDCSHCRGGKNKHAWSFYYYLKRCGDNPIVKVKDGKIYIWIKQTSS